MCGCNKNKNRGAEQIQTTQINPTYRPNPWSNIQRQQNTTAQMNVNKQILQPVDMPIQNNVSPVVQVNNIPVKQVESSVTIQPTVNINRRVVPTRTPYIPTRRPYVPTRLLVDISQAPLEPTRSSVAPPRTPIIQPRTPLDPASQLAITNQSGVHPKFPNRPVRSPVFQNQQPNVPIIAPSQNRPNSNIRTVQLAIPSRSTPVHSPVNLQPTPQTLLANRINSARRR